MAEAVGAYPDIKPRPASGYEEGTVAENGCLGA